MAACRLFSTCLVLCLIARGPAQALEDAVPPTPAPAAGADESRLVPPFRSFAACLEFARAGVAEWQRSQASAALICAALERVWQDPSGAKTAVDDPLRIDLRLPQAGADFWPTPGVAEGALLVAFLTIPNLLPPRLGMGLVFENLVVSGALHLQDAAVGPPVAFRRASFRSDRATLLENHFGFVALDLDQVRFEGALEISESDIQGHVLIDDSTFAGGLTLREIVISSRRARDDSQVMSHIGRTPALSVQNSTIESGLSLTNLLIFNPPVNASWSGYSASFSGNSIQPRLKIRDFYAEAEFKIEKSDLGSVSLSSFQFSGNFVFEHNRMIRLDIVDGNFYDTPYINYNQAAQSVDVNRVGIYLTPDDWAPEIAANRIDGQFLFAPSGFNENVSRIDLTYNRVDGLASLFPPRDSLAEADLSNVEMPTRLEIGRPYWAGAPDPEALYAPAHSVDDFCPDGGERPVRLINLTNATIDILAWNFPIRCDVQWDGAGLTYAYWGDPDLKGDAEHPRTDDDFIESLKAWRFTMQKANSEALDFMAGYLHSRGRFSDSRDLRQEAKEVNYRPKPATDLGGWVVYGLLMPTGFGVKPELALLWLFVGWVIGGGVYFGYRRRSRSLGWPPAAVAEAPALQILREETGSFRHAADAGQSSGAADPNEQPSLVPGFMQYQRDRRPADFSIWAFSADAVLPVINLHAYTEYYPRDQAIRLFSFIQHIIGWWMLSVFLASATIL